MPLYRRTIYRHTYLQKLNNLSASDREHRRVMREYRHRSQILRTRVEALTVKYYDKGPGRPKGSQWDNGHFYKRAVEVGVKWLQNPAHKRQKLTGRRLAHEMGISYSYFRDRRVAYGYDWSSLHDEIVLLAL